jgi:predicted enzyme related to lactoylglutathione lyase
MTAYVMDGVGHFDIVGTDGDALRAFYTGVFAWQALPKGPGYTLLSTPDGTPNGAILEGPTASLTIGVVVPDLSAALLQATALGGAVVMPATNNGWVTKAIVTDPAGNALTLLQG